MTQNRCAGGRRFRTIKILEWCPSDGRFPPAENKTETTMINSQNPAGQSGFINTIAFYLAAVALCVGLVAGAVLLAPAAATSGASTQNTAAYAGPTGFFPDQFVNQAKEIEPMPEIYY